MRVPRKAVIIGVPRMIHDRNPTEHWTRYGTNDDAAHHVQIRASHLGVVGIALTVVACAAAAPGGDGKPVDRPSEQDRYAVPCAFGAKAVYGFTASTVSSPGKWRRVRRVQPSTYSRVRVLLLQQAGHVIVEPSKESLLRNLCQTERRK